MNENTKARRPKGYKPFWENEEEEELEEPETEIAQPVEDDEEDKKRFKLVRGLVSGNGLASVFKKK